MAIPIVGFGFPDVRTAGNGGKFRPSKAEALAMGFTTVYGYLDNANIVAQLEAARDGGWKLAVDTEWFKYGDRITADHYTTHTANLRSRSDLWQYIEYIHVIDEADSWTDTPHPTGAQARAVYTRHVSHFGSQVKLLNLVDDPQNFEAVQYGAADACDLVGSTPYLYDNYAAIATEVQELAALANGRPVFPVIPMQPLHFGPNHNPPPPADVQTMGEICLAHGATMIGVWSADDAVGDGSYVGIPSSMESALPSITAAWQTFAGAPPGRVTDSKQAWNFGSDTVIVTKPDGQVGEVMVVIVHHNDSTVVVDDDNPVGVKTNEYYDQQLGFPVTAGVAIFWRRLTGAEPSTYRFRLTGVPPIPNSQRWGVVAFTVPNVQDPWNVPPAPGNPYGAGTQASPVAPGSTATRAGIAFAVCGIDGVASSHVSGPSGWTEIETIAGAVGSTLSVFFKELGPGVASGDATFILSSADSNSGTLKVFILADQAFPEELLHGLLQARALQTPMRR